MSDWHEWALEYVTGHAERISHSAARLANMPGQLQFQEPFKTKMESALEQAEAELLKAIDAVHDKRIKYSKLPRKVA